MRRLIALPTVLAFLFLACGPAATSVDVNLVKHSTPPPSTVKIAVILEENHSYAQIVGSSAAPYINNTLIKNGVLLDNYWAITHPSLPNYLALISGSTQGCTTDSCGTTKAPEIGLQLTNAGKDWRSYQESMPSACDTSNATPYVKRHNPFVYFTEVLNPTSYCQAHDVAYPSSLPASLTDFTFITPNLNDDMHNGTISQGDTWLMNHVPAIMGGLGSNGFLIVMFDEGTSSTNHVMTVLYGPIVKQGVTLTTKYDHYSTLRLIEEQLGVPLLGSAKSAADITGWHV